MLKSLTPVLLTNDVHPFEIKNATNLMDSKKLKELYKKYQLDPKKVQYIAYSVNDDSTLSNNFTQLEFQIIYNPNGIRFANSKVKGDSNVTTIFIFDAWSLKLKKNYTYDTTEMPDW